MKNNSIKNSIDDTVFEIFVYIVLGITLILVIYPLYFILIASFSDPVGVNTGKAMFFLYNPSLEGYKRIISDNRIWSGYLNTIIYTAVGTTINVVITMMIAYPLSRRSFSGRKAITLFLLVPMYFSGGMIPQYLLVKSLDLLDTRAVMVLLSAASVYNIIVARSFLEANIPEDLYESASMDGCSQFRFFSAVVMPLSKAIIAVLALFYGVSHWNEYMRALIYLKKESLYPLQLILSSILIENQVSAAMVDDVLLMEEKNMLKELIKYGVIVVASVPVLVAYPFLQKFFIKGVMLGSIKG